MSTLIILQLILLVSTGGVDSPSNNIAQLKAQIKKQEVTIAQQAKKKAAALELAKRKSYLQNLRNRNYNRGPLQFKVDFENYIGIDISSQALVVFENKKAVLKTLVSTGIRRFPTPLGIFSLRTKIRSQRMRGYYGPGSPYNFDLPGVPYVMYFYADYSLHGTYWHNNFGTPMSHGCVNLPTWVASWIYYNTALGTPVVIQY